MGAWQNGDPVLPELLELPELELAEAPSVAVFALEPDELPELVPWDEADDERLDPLPLALADDRADADEARLDDARLDPLLDPAVPEEPLDRALLRLPLPLLLEDPVERDPVALFALLREELLPDDRAEVAWRPVAEDPAVDDPRADPVARPDEAPDELETEVEV